MSAATNFWSTYRPLIIRLSQVVMGAIFLWAGLAKIGDLGGFVKQVHNFRLVPIALENLFAMTLPWIEVVAGMALILGIRARGGAYLTAGLMIAFTLAVAQAVARNLDIECGCFGTGDATQVGLKKLVENTVMVGVSLVACLRPGPD